MPSYDNEYVGGLLAQLRAEHPDVPLSKLADMIDWECVPGQDETRDAFAARIYGPVEEIEGG